MADVMTIGHTLLQWGIVAMLVKGGLVMIPLLAASLISTTVILKRSVFWRRLRWQAIDSTILSYVAEGHLEHATQIAAGSSHPIARALYAGLVSRHHAPGMAMEAAAQGELPRAKAYLSMLDTIITLAPLLGLLGTITGMISAFGIVSDTGLEQPMAITGGTAEALIATATGLCVALLRLLPYNYFRAKVERLTERMEEQATRLEHCLNRREGCYASGVSYAVQCPLTAGRMIEYCA